MYWVISLAVLFWILKNREGIWKGLQSNEDLKGEPCSFESEVIKQQEMDEIKAYFEAKIVPDSRRETTHD